MIGIRPKHRRRLKPQRSVASLANLSCKYKLEIVARRYECRKIETGVSRQGHDHGGQRFADVRRRGGGGMGAAGIFERLA